MKLFLSAFFLLTPALCGADTFILKDGARLEGEVTGEMDGVVLVKTKYGALSINRADIQEQQAAQLPQPAAPAQAAPVEVSTATAAEAPVEQISISTAQPEQLTPPAVPEGMVGAAPALTFKTTQPSPDARLLVYYENGVAVATETYDSAGTLLASEGRAPDGTYTEYYDEGGLKTVKTMMGGKANGTLKAYYPSGALQAEAYYFVGAREGLFKYLTEEGRPLMEADYRNDKLHGWKKDYGPDGAVAAEAYYQDGLPAAPAGTQAATAIAAELLGGEDSQVTVKTIRLARGERFDFKLNGKYMGRARLDRDFNLIDLDGKMPDGTVKAYSKDGKLQKEFVFEGRQLKLLRVYEDGGPLAGEYSYLKGKAVKK